MKRNLFALFLVVILNCFSMYGQSKIPYDWYLSQSNGSLCSQSILLFADSTYCSESGCEASSHFSFGKWKMKKDTILFMPVVPSEYKVISSVKTSRTDDKRITVIIYDNQGVNITKRIKTTQFVKKVGFYSMDLDSSQTRRSDARRVNGSIVLNTLQRIFRQDIDMPTDSSNVYEIYLNISYQWNFHGNSDWLETGGLRLIRSKEKLVSVRPDQFDEKGLLKPSVFIKQVK
jgi:hypothetical protein